jgi:hypothetical protein
VLRSSLREFLCSEAMHWLGVPTTRALSLVATGEIVIRDMFYDGNPEPEPGAVVCRVAPSFVRFGNFQIHAAHQELDALRRLADYVIREHYAGLTYPDFFHELCRRTALLMVDWMRLGFVHGVMNTDNMSILGPHHRLRSVRLARGLRSALDAEHHRRAGAALRLRPAAAHRAVEPRAPRRGAASPGPEGNAWKPDWRCTQKPSTPAGSAPSWKRSA